MVVQVRGFAVVLCLMMVNGASAAQVDEGSFSYDAMGPSLPVPVWRDLDYVDGRTACLLLDNMPYPVGPSAHVPVRGDRTWLGFTGTRDLIDPAMHYYPFFHGGPEATICLYDGNMLVYGDRSNTLDSFSIDVSYYGETFSNFKVWVHPPNLDETSGVLHIGTMGVTDYWVR